MTLTYQLAEGPDVICAQMLQGCAKQALEKLEEKNVTQEDPSEWADVRSLTATTLLLHPPFLVGLAHELREDQ